MQLLKICLVFAVAAAVPAYLFLNTPLAISLATVAAVLVLIWHQMSLGFVLKSLSVQRMTEASANNVIHRLFLGDAYQLKTQVGLGDVRFYLIETDAPVAFSMGTRSSTGYILVSSGLFKTLNRDEIGAVIAHEMGHIRAGDSALNAMRIAQSGVARLLGLSGLVSLMKRELPQTFLVSKRVMRPEKRADAFSAKVFRDGKILASALKKLERGILSVHWNGFDRLPFLSAIAVVDAIAARKTYDRPQYSKTAYRVAELLQIGAQDQAV